MSNDDKLLRTVGDIRELLKDLPGDLPIEFSPITGAYLGANYPLRVKDIKFYAEKGWRSADPDEEGAYGTIYIWEDDSTDDSSYSPPDYS